MTDKKNIYQRIAAVTDEIGSFPKDGKNTQFNFRYAGIEQIVSTIQPVCIKHGICLIQEAVATGVFENVNKNGAVILSCVDVLTHAVNVDNPEERVTTRTPAHGFDTLDKGIYKAISGGRKYAIFGMFNLMAGDDEPDADMGRGNEPPRQRTRSDIPPDDTFPPEPPVSGKGGLSDHPTDKQIKYMHVLFKKIGYDEEKRKAWIAKWFGHTDSMKDLTFEEGQALIDWLKKKDEEGGNG